MLRMRKKRLSGTESAAPGGLFLRFFVSYPQNLVCETEIYLVKLINLIKQHKNYLQIYKM